MAIIYKEFYNKDRGLTEPIWGARAQKTQCPTCGSRDMYYSAHPDNPEEILIDNVRCKNCGHITDYFEASQQLKNHPVHTPVRVDRIVE